MYLCWHVHQQHSSDGGLGLTVALLRPVQGVGLQHTEQVLLPGWMDGRMDGHRNTDEIINRFMNSANAAAPGDVLSHP